MQTMKLKRPTLEWAAWVLIMIGAVNWGTVGLFQFDMVQAVFGTAPALAKTLYGLIGASGVYWVYLTLIAKR